MKHRTKVYNWLISAQWRLLPPNCVLCSAPAERPLDLCPACLRDFQPNLCACSHCALPLPEPGICGACQRKPPKFDATVAAFEYGEPLSHLILALKFQQKLHLARLLGELLARRMAQLKEPRPELIIPVPLHPRRLRERGYNQALELARFVGRRLEIPLDIHTLQRTHVTEAQSRLHEKERRRNVRGAFELVRPLTAEYVVLLDDVMTTGATVNECARILKSGGVKRVDVWAVARAGRDK